MKSESIRARRQRKEQIRVQEVLLRLSEEYRGARCALVHANAFQLLVATILSAQCTDERVNMVTPQLFENFPNSHALAEADELRLQDLIRSTGFFRNKSRNLIGASRTLKEEFEGRVPQSMEELLRLPGVARKTANVVLGTAFGIASGVVVDTHVSRVSQRLGLTSEKSPERIEQDLMHAVPQEEWIDFSHWVIHHGRRVCSARKPKCERCVLADVCPYFLQQK